MEVQEQEIENDVELDGKEVEIRRTTRTSRQPTRLRDYITYKVSKERYPIQDFIFYKYISSQHILFLTFISKEQEPNDYIKITKNSKWCQAMYEELKVLKKNKTWVIVII
jgi:hypothetical protein